MWNQLWCAGSQFAALALFYATYIHINNKFAILNIMNIIKGTGLLSNINSKYSSSTFYIWPPGHWTWSLVDHFIKSIQSCRYFGALARCTHCHLCPAKYSFIQVKHRRVKCLAKGYDIESMSQCWKARNMTFLWKSCPKRSTKPQAVTFTKFNALTIATRPSLIC